MREGHHILQPNGAGRTIAFDPRAAIVATVAFALVVALARAFPALGLSVALAGATLLLTGGGFLVFLKRYVAFFAFAGVLMAVVPWRMSAPDALWRCGPFVYSASGVAVAARVIMKGMAILLVVHSLLGPHDLVTLGHAMERLRAPKKLVRLLLFVVRYIDVLEHEYARMHRAMRMRAFRPRIARHTYRAYGYLAGMLLVRSIDRSERVLAAMKCRGFRDGFPSFHSLCFTYRDAILLTLTTCWAAAVILLDFGGFI